jgi:hypothetical protein
MKKVLTMSLIAVIGLAAYGCTKTEKINASATAAQCDGVNNDRACCGSVDCAVRKLANAKLAATGDSSDCPLWGTPACPLAAKAAAAKAKPAAAGNAKSCCANKAKAKPAAAGDAKSCCASKKAAVKPAATSSKNKANCDPADCGSWKKGKKGSGSGCPFSGS